MRNGIKYGRPNEGYDRMIKSQLGDHEDDLDEARLDVQEAKAAQAAEQELSSMPVEVTHPAAKQDDDKVAGQAGDADPFNGPHERVTWPLGSNLVRQPSDVAVAYSPLIAGQAHA